MKEDIPRAGHKDTKQCEKWEVKGQDLSQCQYPDGWIKNGEELEASKDRVVEETSRVYVLEMRESGVGRGGEGIVAVEQVCEAQSQKARISNGGLSWPKSGTLMQVTEFSQEIKN